MQCALSCNFYFMQYYPYRSITVAFHCNLCSLSLFLTLISVSLYSTQSIAPGNTHRVNAHACVPASANRMQAVWGLVTPSLRSVQKWWNHPVRRTPRRQASSHLPPSRHTDQPLTVQSSYGSATCRPVVIRTSHLPSSRHTSRALVVQSLYGPDTCRSVVVRACSQWLGTALYTADT